jgi:hypothetical protein
VAAPNVPASPPKIAALAIITLALIHVGSLLFAAEGPVDGFLVGLLGASALPYALCLALLKWTKSVGPALGGTLAIVLLDAWMYWSVFISPRGSTAALGLLFAPLWKLFILLPLGAAVGFAVERLVRRGIPR